MFSPRVGCSDPFDNAFNRADVDALFEVFDDLPTKRITNNQVFEADQSGLRAAFTQRLSSRPKLRNRVCRVLR